MTKPNHPLPRAVFDQHIIFLGKTRSGKSSAMRDLVEDLLDREEPVCIVDPKGDWWGLKSSADGKHAGYQVVIFGGEHADVPLNARSGASVAELFATGNRSGIIDMGGWMPGDRTQFWIDFASTYFRFHRGRHYLVIDEVHNFCPKGKIMDPNAGKMLHWSNRLASEGLGKGISMIAASQRPQKVHNDYLTSCETLVAMRVIHKADRDAIKDWIDACGDMERGREVLNTVASMKRGEGWAYSPEAEFGPVRVQFPMFKTYDSFKPQKSGSAVKLKGWADVDLAEITKKLEAAVKEAEANDPAKLKAKIRELEQQLKNKPSITKEVMISDPKAIERALRPYVDGMKYIAQHAEKIIVIAGNAASKVPAGEILAKETPHVRPGIASRLAHVVHPRPEPPPNGDVKLASGALRLLAAVAQWHPNGITGGQMRAQAGLKKSGTVDTYLSRLRTANLLYMENGLFHVTEEGLSVAGSSGHSAPTTTEEVLTIWKPKLGSGAWRVFNAIFAYQGKPISKEQVMQDAGFAASGTLDTYLSRLRTARLIKREDGGFAADKETLLL